MVSTIGLKIANGEFYSILEENSQVKKRLVLTTVHNNQQSAQIDLYRSYTQTMADALYIGSLVMENIKPLPKGEPSIELVITSSRNGDITADAVYLDGNLSKDRQSLSVSLRSLDEDSLDADIPDYELEDTGTSSDGLYDRASKIESRETREGRKGKFPWFIVACIALVLTAIALLIWLFFFHGEASPRSIIQRPAATRTAAPPPAQPATSAPPAAAQPATSPAAAPPVAAAPPPQPVTPPPAAQPATPAPPPQPVTPPPVIQAPVRAPVAAVPPPSRTRTAPPVASFDVPAVIPREGFPYRVRYGDTLWDIAEAFYRNPWLYPRIAQFNNIRNPDLIITGTTIRVPPRN